MINLRLSYKNQRYAFDFLLIFYLNLCTLMDDNKPKTYFKRRAENSSFITISGAISITGLSAPTLRKFADEQKVSSYKTPTGVRMFNKQCLLDMCNNALGNEQSAYSKGVEKKNFIYARVSSHHQMDDLTRQIEFLQSRTSEELGHFTLIRDIGSGINFKRKGIQTILDACLRGSIGKLVVTHKDRLSRFAFELFEYLVERAGGQIIVCDHSDKNMSDEQELAEDLLSIVHVFSCKQMGKRRYSKKPKDNGVCIENTDLSNGGTTEGSPSLGPHISLCVQQSIGDNQEGRSQIEQYGTQEQARYRDN